jgi:hypothetical protein
VTQQSRVRAYLKRHIPLPLRALYQRLRESVAPPPIDDVVLADYRVVPDGEARPRLTLVLPMLLKGSDFGGTATGIDLFSRLFLAVSATVKDIDLRVLVTDVVAETDIGMIAGPAAKAGLHIRPDQIELVPSTSAQMAVRADEVFVTYNWWVTLNFAKVRDAQSRLFKSAPLPVLWLIQDYEPAFWNFCSAHLLAREAYDTTAPLWGLINSSSLADYIALMGHRPARSFVFEPVISDALRPYLPRVADSRRAKRVLVYGRPNVERNCFPALVRGLRRWATDYPQFADWEVISAGMAHDPVDLGGGRKLVSVGKLSLDDYAEVLLTSAAGVSLMASPHPSYPPLEMAHLGVRTVTNAYLCKDLASFHPNIISLSSIAEDNLAAALAAACAASAEPPATIANPSYVRAERYPFLDELASAVGAVLRAEANRKGLTDPNHIAPVRPVPGDHADGAP